MESPTFCNRNKCLKITCCHRMFLGFDPKFTKEKREYDQNYLPGSYNRERKKKWFAQPISIKITIWLWPLQILWQYWGATTELIGREHMKEQPRRPRRSGNRQRLRRFVGQKTPTNLKAPFPRKYGINHRKWQRIFTNKPQFLKVEIFPSSRNVSFWCY